MKLFVIGAALAATFAAALPAAAQTVVVREGNGYHRDHGWRHAHAECRVVKTKKYLPNGNVIIKTRRTC